MDSIEFKSTIAFATQQGHICTELKTQGPDRRMEKRLEAEVVFEKGKEKRFCNMI